jgi:hypothetical protein
VSDTVAQGGFDLDECILEAWERCGLTGDVMTGAVLRSARRSATLMLQAWQTKGINLWQVRRDTWTQASLVVSAIDCVLPVAADVVNVLEVTTIEYGRELPITPFSRDEWVAVPDKLTTGLPTSYWAERSLPAQRVHLWPAPIGMTLAGAMWVVAKPETPGAYQGGLVVPLLWQDAVCAELAARLAVKYAPERVEGLRGEAERAFRDASGEDRERVPLTLMPRLSR